MKLRDARILKKLSQEEMSKKVDCSLRHYNKIENGGPIPSVILALDICKVLSINPFDVDEWKSPLRDEDESN
ncbi:MAG: transcriptional regulator [Bacilli bacterium]|nr:transcriptional regulator [Bacilli bacterium]